MIEIVIASFKYIGMLLTGAFGVLGLLVKFKDEEGRVTRDGRKALVLIVSSTLIAVCAHSLELLRAKTERRSAEEAKTQETLEAVRRTERLIVEINRGLHPIAGLSLGYWISVPSDHVELKPYIQRFGKAVPATVEQLEKVGLAAGIVYVAFDSSRNIESFAFNAASPLAPDRRTEKLAYTIFGYSRVELEFYRMPIAISDHPLMGGSWKNVPDLRLGVTAGLDAVGKDGRHSVSYDIKNMAFKLRARRIPSDPKYWDSNGEVVGVPDLLGSQLVIRIFSAQLSGDVSKDQYVAGIRQRFRLETLVISFPGGMEFWLRTDDFVSYTDKEGYPLYVYTFPDTMAELQELNP